MKLMPIIGCMECKFAKFTERDVFCKLLSLPCGKSFWRRKSLRLLKNHPEWCPLEDDIEEGGPCHSQNNRFFDISY